MTTGSASLPHHQYVWVDQSFIREGGSGWEPAVWFGLHSHPGRAWGCHVMLECGAVYRGLPPHALAFDDEPDDWTLPQAQMYDCYGWSFSLLRYTFLTGLQARATNGILCDYLFTAVPIGDGYSEHPSQSKEFMFMRTKGERLLILPTNKLRFVDKSFTAEVERPRLKLADTVWSCEEE
jgi:hypothetical protein